MKSVDQSATVIKKKKQYFPRSLSAFIFVSLSKGFFSKFIQSALNTAEQTTYKLYTNEKMLG